MKAVAWAGVLLLLLVVADGGLIYRSVYTSSSTVYDVVSKAQMSKVGGGVFTAESSEFAGGSVYSYKSGSTSQCYQYPSPGLVLPNSAYTTATWVKGPWLQSGDGWQTLFRGLPNDHHILVNVGSRQLGVYVNGDGNFFGSGFYMDSALADGNWHHLAAIHTGGEGSTGSTAFYWDGVLVGTSSGKARTELSGNKLVTFSGAGSYGSCSQGWLEPLYDTRVYDHALSVQDIQTVMSTTKDPGLLLHLSFDGNTATDLVSGNAMNVITTPTYGTETNFFSTSKSTIKMGGSGCVQYPGGGFWVPNEYTTMIWFKGPWATSHPNAWHTLTRGLPDDHPVLVDSTSGLLAVYINTGYDQAYYSTFNLQAAASADRWYHFAAVHTGGEATAGTTTFYLDGVQVGQSSAKARTAQSVMTLPTFLGAAVALSPSQCTQGWLAESTDFRIYNYALNTSELLDIIEQSKVSYGVCSNGTLNDPSAALPSPILTSSTISNNNYEVSIQLDMRYSEVSIAFVEGSSSTTTCDFDSTAGSSAVWTTTTDSDCTRTLTFSKSAQSTISSQTGGCGFSRQDNTPQAGFSSFTKSLAIKTKQERTIQHAQNLRNSSYSQVITTHYQMIIVVPSTVTASVTNRNISGPVNVLSALSQLDVSGSPTYTVSVTLITSSQYPYQLTFASTTTSSHLGTATATEATPSCTGAQTCAQQFTFADVPITTTCPDKSTLNDQFDVTFTVGCRAEFTGNCITPNPSSQTAPLTLVSSAYCPLVDNVTLLATLSTYRDEELTNPNAWSNPTSAYVVGTTLYGQAELSVGQGAATLASTTITSISTEASLGSVTVFPSGGASTQDTGFTNSASISRFAVPLLNDQTLAIDPRTDVEQAVIISVTLSATYTTQGVGTGQGADLLRDMGQEHNAKEFTVMTSTRPASASTSIAVSTTSISAAPAGSGSSAAGMSSSTVLVAAGAVLALAVMAAAYFAGVRNSVNSTEQQELMSHTPKGEECAA